MKGKRGGREGGDQDPSVVCWNPGTSNTVRRCHGQSHSCTRPGRPRHLPQRYHREDRRKCHERAPQHDCQDPCPLVVLSVVGHVRDEDSNNIRMNQCTDVEFRRLKRHYSRGDWYIKGIGRLVTTTIFSPHSQEGSHCATNCNRRTVSPLFGRLRGRVRS